jgi:glycosyltransferase involved in cell wall biosynthesis
MKIALVNHQFMRYSGQGLVNVELASYLARQGHAVTLGGSAVEPELLALQGLSWRRIAEPDRGPFIFRELCFLVGATWILSRLKGFDVVHLNGGIALGPHTTNTCHFCHSAAAPATGAGFGRRAYLRLYRRYNAWLERRVYRQTRKAVVAVSGKVRQELIHQAGIEGHKVVVIHNGVDLAAFHNRDRAGERQRLGAEWGLPPDACVFLFAGDVRTPRKGLPTLLEAMRLLQNPRVSLLIAGGQLPPEWDSLAKSPELRGAIRVIGFRSDLPRLMRGADAFVFPTTYDSCPTVVLQALGTGCPLIVSSARYCGASELLAHGESAYLLEDPTDARQVAQAMEVLASDPELRARLGRAGREVAEEYTWERMAQRYEELFLSHG